MFKTVCNVCILSFLVSCSSMNKKITEDTNQIKPKSKQELIMKVQSELKKSTKISNKEKLEFNKRIDSLFLQKKKLITKRQKLFTLLIDQVDKSKYSLDESRTIVSRIGKVEKKILKVKMKMLGELSIFVKDELKEEQVKDYARELLIDRHFYYINN